MVLVTLALAGPANAANGGASPNDPTLQPPGKASLAHGRALAPAGAPAAVTEAIDAANRIATKPYKLGGGHGDFEDTHYDCSGAVSYVLHGAGVLDAPLASGGLMSWGERGRGRWITVYANREHTFVVIAGLRFDTGYRDATSENTGTGPRWGGPRPTRGYRVRHPAGL